MYVNRLLDVMFTDYRVDSVLCLLLCCLVVRRFNEIQCRPHRGRICHNKIWCNRTSQSYPPSKP